MNEVTQNQSFTSWRIRKMKIKRFIKTVLPYILLITVLLLICLYAAHKGRLVGKVSKLKVITPVASASATPTFIVKEDKRVVILKNFLTDKQSPLASYSAYFVQSADKYGLDWTLMPAISGMESNFGKNMPKDSNNPFGVGGGHLMRFTTIYNAIDFEGKLLSKDYKLAANNAIGSIYCPKYECNQNWAIIVTGFSEEILN